MWASEAGGFYSPIEVAEKLQDISQKYKCNQFRISGVDLILGKPSTLHLAEVIRLASGPSIVEIYDFIQVASDKMACCDLMWRDSSLINECSDLNRVASNKINSFTQLS